MLVTFSGKIDSQGCVIDWTLYGDSIECHQYHDENWNPVHPNDSIVLADVEFPLDHCVHWLGYHGLFHDDARLDANYDNYHVSGSVYLGRIQDKQWVARTPGDL